MNILLTGGTGFIGKALCAALLQEGHMLIVLTRNAARAEKIIGASVHCITSFVEIPDDTEIDAIINLAGEPVFCRWDTQKKKEILASRTGMTERIILLCKRLNKTPKLLISGSAVGYYGTHPEHVFTEKSKPDSHHPGVFARKLCEAWESEAKEAETLGIRTCLLRTGIVLAREGGVLAQMWLPFSMGLGGVMGSGQQWFSWIHRDDLIGIIMHCIKNKKIHGPINGTAPHPVTHETFAKALAKQLNRPLWFRMPSSVIKWVYGEMAEELLLHGQKVIPEKALHTGYPFKYPTLTKALKDV